MKRIILPIAILSVAHVVCAEPSGDASKLFQAVVEQFDANRFDVALSLYLK